jgi:hypothetical protein
MIQVLLGTPIYHRWHALPSEGKVVAGLHLACVRVQERLPVVPFVSVPLWSQGSAELESVERSRHTVSTRRLWWMGLACTLMASAVAVGGLVIQVFLILFHVILLVPIGIVGRTTEPVTLAILRILPSALPAAGLLAATGVVCLLRAISRKFVQGKSIQGAPPTILPS